MTGSLSEAYDEGYDKGHEQGLEEGVEAFDSDAYDEGYGEGFSDGRDEAPELNELILEEFRKALLNPLEDVAVRWDAAEKAFIFTQEGRSVTFRGS